MRRFLLCTSLGCALSAASATAWAQSAADRSLAQSLFEDAKQLMADGKFAEACPKLAESQRLDPSGGTMINLALCHEGEGKISSAWSDFKEALSMSRRDGRSDREAACQEHIAGLQPKLPRVTLDVQGRVTGEQVTLDGAMIGPAAWGLATPLDPGTHQVEVSAPGKKPWQGQFELAIAEQKAFTIPALVDESASAPAAGAAAPGDAAAPPDDGSGAGKQRMIGYIVGGSGIALIGVGAVFGFRALSKRSESDSYCPADDRCTPEGVALNDEAKTSAWIANIGVGLGLVGVGVGTYLIVTAKGQESTPAHAAKPRRLWMDANMLPGGGRLVMGGAW